MTSITNISKHFSHFACCRQRPVFALQVLEEYGATMGNYSNSNGANVMHFLFCPFSECMDFENIFKTMEYLQVGNFWLQKNFPKNSKK